MCLSVEAAGAQFFQLFIEGSVGEEEVLQFVVFHLFDDAVAAQEEYVAGAEVCDDVKSGPCAVFLVGLYGAGDDVALGEGACFLFGEFTGSDEVVDQGVVARLEENAAARSELVDAAVADMGYQDAVRTKGKEGECGAHLAARGVVGIELIEGIVGESECFLEILLHFLDATQGCVGKVFADGFGDAVAGHFALFVSTDAVAHHEDAMVGGGFSRAGEEGVLLVGFLSAFGEIGGLQYFYFHIVCGVCDNEKSDAGEAKRVPPRGFCFLGNLDLLGLFGLLPLASYPLPLFVYYLYQKMNFTTSLKMA